MVTEKRQTWADLTAMLPPAVSREEIDGAWQEAVASIAGKIIVLDDDPTGVQTVHGIPVYTSWEPEILRQVFNDPCKLIYILTNSRALTAEQTEVLHRQIARELLKISREQNIPFQLISRGDSTLRGHYPLETQVIYEEYQKAGIPVDGEIIAPFFLEGGRYTYADVHYVKEGDMLVPAGQTEFAKDGTFGYKSSDLKEWVEEKTEGRFPAGRVQSVSLEDLRHRNLDRISEPLLGLKNFNKLVLNAFDYTDLKIFSISLAQALAQGKRYLYRTAAPFVQVMGGIIPKPILTKETLYPAGRNPQPGLIVAGSYVQKTTRQLEKLLASPDLTGVEWDVSKAQDDEGLEKEVARVIKETEAAFQAGRNVCIYTSREYLWRDPLHQKSESNLIFSNRVSLGLVRVIQGLSSRPGFLVAKGGVTSSDVGVRALKVKRAMVMGQILPGVPVWHLGPESLFPGAPYVIFPGNVGTEDSLKAVYEVLKI
ncbi:MAG: four-carbon acid sugar kinase family protein [Clostridia bacterium]|jgi:uncharacterized protein YgbK (DUF1537 family)|nr:four-carbon acid sugar kinase family protein [Clostridia bacterium]